jgi:hypothetical protein
MGTLRQDTVNSLFFINTHEVMKLGTAEEYIRAYLSFAVDQ